MREIRIVLTDADEVNLNRILTDGTSPGPLINSLVVSALREAVRDRPVLRAGAYVCPICAMRDPNAYLRCNRPNCTDGRDPR